MKKVYELILLLFIVASCSTNPENDNSFSFSNGNTAEYDEMGEFQTGDQYEEYVENPFVYTSEAPISTFSIDADGASYGNMRRFIMQENMLPPRGDIRTEELINYFNLDYEFNGGEHPISLNGELSGNPWNSENKLIRIGIKGKTIPESEDVPSNFVFLIDVSGSMASEDKLELLKNGFKYFVDGLGAEDRIAIVTYAGSAGVLLASTSGTEKNTIKNAIDQLGAGGSTAGAAGISTAYEIAQENFIENGNNRIILGTDGDFNVGISNREELIALIEEKRASKIFLTVLGVGRGNLNDAALEQIANYGNGNYEYIDNPEQLRKVFIYDYSKFYTIAKDVKVQVAFNPEVVEAYRLIGYENRILDTEDFEDDTEDAGEIGAGQNITALYEIVPVGTISENLPAFTVDFRYKLPDSDVSIPIQLEIFDEAKTFSESSDFMKFTAGISAFSMLLSDSEYKGTSSYDQVLEWINSTNLRDEHGFKAEFKDIVTKAKDL
ncbi:von Willebrand factor type A domain-containing protein [Zunongwangia sp. SCSIO 43204]|uniref:vWA domain-containing protein n=1 Tax=Zunongwangia sp. SCSIO 43204 TaxID=2779359 RepID=UPI001CA87B15|nr:von Willebrand factor type A domain-containing protein [Zunongwangia sp. SCSIO 43204]UAB84177.1 von Willebrand factor type A domain-containing protein [Zunongwangia sp. SCSIO 43204]